MREVLKKLFLPGLEKALVFLDKGLLEATSTAVERGNRRYRRMQKTAYRVRTRPTIDGRLALDLLRERHAGDRAKTTKSIHKARRHKPNDSVSLVQCQIFEDLTLFLFQGA